MNVDWLGLFGVLGPISICVMFTVLGLLSRRLGRVTRVRPYHLGMFLAACLVGISAVVRLINLGLGAGVIADFVREPVLVLVYNGLPALGITVGVVTAWRYWSWLFAERD